MEFHEKIQLLRKRESLTQEELAEILHVSRAAVSKWESGRGYPNIDSLKQIASFFHITIDELLSSEEVLTIAEEGQKEIGAHLLTLVFGLLDLSVAVFLFLPVFGQPSDQIIQSVPLLALTQISPYLKVSYFLIIGGLIGFGILMLALQNYRHQLWTNHKYAISILLDVLGTLLFIVSKQPYAAATLFTFLSIKVLLLTKKR